MHSTPEEKLSQQTDTFISAKIAIRNTAAEKKIGNGKRFSDLFFIKRKWSSMHGNQFFTGWNSVGVVLVDAFILMIFWLQFNFMPSVILCVWWWVIMWQPSTSFITVHCARKFIQEWPLQFFFQTRLKVLDLVARETIHSKETTWQKFEVCGSLILKRQDLLSDKMNESFLLKLSLAKVSSRVFFV